MSAFGACVCHVCVCFLSMTVTMFDSELNSHIFVVDRSTMTNTIQYNMYCIVLYLLYCIVFTIK